MPWNWIIILILLFCLLTVAGTTIYYLLFRFSFKKPSVDAFQGMEIKAWKGIPYLMQNGLPYPVYVNKSNRPSLSLDGKWLFSLDSGAGEQPPLPLTGSNSIEMDVPGCFNTAESPWRDYQGGVWYQRKLTVPPEMLKERSILRLAFLGSFYKTEAWLDNHFLGSHEGGYQPFYFNLTGLVRPGIEHTLSVRVNNSLHYDTIPPKLFPGHRPGWHPYGGLHKSVLIESCPEGYLFKVAVETSFNGAKGTVRVGALFHRGTSPEQPAKIPVVLKVYGASGDICGEKHAVARFEEGETVGGLEEEFSLHAPLPWSPDDPNNYTLHLAAAGEEIEVNFGFRKVEVSNNRILLNGKEVLLKGVCRHQEDRQHGLAQPVASIKQELDMIKELNGNFVRFAHYPHHDAAYDHCDRLGLCVWSEIPLYQAGSGLIQFFANKSKDRSLSSYLGLPRLIYKTGLLSNPRLLAQSLFQLLAMIERHKNHPSVLFWGLGNECWSLNPAAEKALGWLKKQVQNFDGRRLLAYAAYTIPYLTERFERSFRVMDVIGINEYFGWYYGKPEDITRFMEKITGKYPRKPVIITETGADCVSGWHEPNAGPPPKGYSEEYQCHLLETQWKHLVNVPGFAGLSIWVLKDFLCPEYREDNPVPFYNLKGLLDSAYCKKLSFETVKRLYGNEPDFKGQR